MDAADASESFSRDPTIDDLVTLCKALQDTGVEYVVIGGFAVSHHGLVRATGDIDLLVDAAPNNIDKIRTALSYLPDRAVLDVRPGDVREYTVVRVADEIVIDLLHSACGVTYHDAKHDVDWTEVRGVRIPFLGLRSLLKTKQSIRPRDVEDRIFLQERLKGLPS